MAKSLLILMLIATQLLTGTCGPLYLCISNDGSVCCVDAGPESCRCCKRHCEVPDEACCHEHDHNVGSECSEDCEEATEQSIVDAVPCGCKHIPLVVAPSSPTIVARSAIQESVERYSHTIAWAPTFVFAGDAFACPPQAQWYEEPLAPDFALTIISTVVFRC